MYITCIGLRRRCAVSGLASRAPFCTTSQHRVISCSSRIALPTLHHTHVNWDTRDSKCLPLRSPVTSSSAHGSRAGSPLSPTGTPMPPATGDSDSSKSCPPTSTTPRPRAIETRIGNWLVKFVAHRWHILLNAIAVVSNLPGGPVFPISFAAGLDRNTC